MAQAKTGNSAARIMIVDDNPEFLNGLKLTLEMENYTVITALNGSQALEILKTAEKKGTNALPDIVLTDI